MYLGNCCCQIEDLVVCDVGWFKVVIDLGFNVGFLIKWLFNDYDVLIFLVDVKWNVNDVYCGVVIMLQISYVMLVSCGVLVVIGVSVKYVDDDYVDYYYSVLLVQNFVSGLLLFQVCGGWVSYGGNVLVVVDFDGDFINGGFVVFVFGVYSCLCGDVKCMFYIVLCGDVDQWNGVLGVVYMF